MTHCQWPGCHVKPKRNKPMCGYHLARLPKAIQRAVKGVVPGSREAGPVIAAAVSWAETEEARIHGIRQIIQDERQGVLF